MILENKILKITVKRGNNPELSISIYLSLIHTQENMKICYSML